MKSNLLQVSELNLTPAKEMIDKATGVTHYLCTIEIRIILMQERYLGDVHDYVKYAILRAWAEETGCRIGVNWYLTKPDDVDPTHSNDGEKRHHLNQPTWEDYDPQLLQKLRELKEREHRKIQNFPNTGILSEMSTYFSELVPFDANERILWHSKAMSKLSNCDVVFLDPDNGFEVKSMSGKKKAKYAYYKEVDDYRNAGKTTITIQFARQCDPVKRAKDIRCLRAKQFPNDINLPVLRARNSPNVLFFFSAPQHQNERIMKVQQKIATGLGSTKIELIR